MFNNYAKLSLYDKKMKRIGINKDSIFGRTILRRDNYKCRLCHSNIDIEIHHITPVVIGGETQEDNLITLCDICHHLIHYCNPNLRMNHKKLTKIGLEKAKLRGTLLGRPSKSRDKIPRRRGGYILRWNPSAIWRYNDSLKKRKDMDLNFFIDN